MYRIVSTHGRHRRQPSFNEGKLEATGRRAGHRFAEEPLADRRERAWGLPREYAAVWADHISDIMDGDVGDAQYFQFSMWNTAPWGHDFVAIGKRLQRACQFATCDVFPEAQRGSLNRLPPTICVSAILLPAEKQDGVPHVHGFFRVPTAAVRLPFSLVTIQQNGEDALVFTPSIIGRVVHHVRTFAGHARTSFHVDHKGLYTVDLVGDVERRFEKLSYLLHRGPEVRSWDRMECVPWNVWRRAEQQRSSYPRFPPQHLFQERLRREESRRRHRGWLERSTLAVARSMAKQNTTACGSGQLVAR